MSEKIIHKGKIVKKISDTKYLVEISQLSACSSCSMSNSCCSAGDELSGKLFTVESSKTLSEGEKVEVSLSKKSLSKSILIAYFIPVVLVIVVALTVDKIFAKDILTAMSSVLTILVYFLIAKFLLKNTKSLDVKIE